MRIPIFLMDTLYLDDNVFLFNGLCSQGQLCFVTFRYITHVYHTNNPYPRLALRLMFYFLFNNYRYIIQTSYL